MKKINEIKLEKHSPEQFWTDWLAADEETRLKMVEKTMIARELAERLTSILSTPLKNGKQFKINKRFIKETTARQVNDYFEDLENVLRVRK
ncbi:MAG: hypothetical protein ABIJ21_05970 [Nanoarchaeota archaeon]